MSDLREYLAANMFDGDGESGIMTAPIKSHLDTIVENVTEWMERAAPSPALTRSDLEAFRRDIRALGKLTPGDWDERRGGDPIARTINAVEDILDHYMTDGVRETHAGSQSAPSASPALTREALLKLQSDLHGWDMTRGWTAFNVIVARLDEVLEALIGTPPPAPTWKVTGKTLAEWDTGTSTLTSTREETP